jgi:predicted transcriptional regulator
MSGHTIERLRTVADAMVKQPKVHPPSTTVAELATFFADEHVHIALLVDDGGLIGTVERSDLAAACPDDAPASVLATTDGRTIDAGVPLPDALTAMRLGGRRRLAVTNAADEVVGLLCLKASGRGFCSDADVEARQRGVRKSARPLP